MDQNGIGYFDWMDLITNTYDDALQKAHVDLKFGDNRALRNKELDFASGEWERIKFFKQRLPNTDDLCHVLDRFVDRMPEMEYGHRREYRLAVAHEVAVDRWLKGKVFAPEDRKYILDRERYLAEEYFNNDRELGQYIETDYEGYKRISLQRLFIRFLDIYDDFYRCYEIRKDKVNKP